MPQYKEHINDGKTVIASPHKVYGPERDGYQAAMTNFRFLASPMLSTEETVARLNAVSTQ